MKDELTGLENRKQRNTMNDINGHRREIIALTSGDAGPAEAAVLLPDGGQEKRALAVHPLAQMIPLITPGDLDRLIDDIMANGVNEPLDMYQGRVLDGRNRLAVASVLGVPVQLREFDGDEAAAKTLVWSKNVARRHLTIPQLALAAARFGLIADAQARPGARRAADATGPAPWASQVSRQLGGAVSPRTLERFDDARVTEAPDTVARIESGALRRIDNAVKEAAAERSLRTGRHVDPPPAVARTAWDRLGCARGDVLAAERAITSGEPGAMTPEQFAGRAREIQASLIRIQNHYKYSQRPAAVPLGRIG
jgi:hypothetical protein